MKYLTVDCGDCKECCHNFVLCGEDLSFAELSHNFYFSREMCDIFYNLQPDGTYRIGQTCKAYKNGLCSLHNNESKPLSCRLYPLFIVSDKKKNIVLMIDTNCRECKNILVALKDQVYLNNILDMINEYLKNNKIIIFPQKGLKNLGYKLKKIQILP